MKKEPKVIQISGFRGLAFVVFVAACLCAGFVVFPAFVAMYTWNYITSYFYAVPQINIWQGILLWAFIALSFYTFNKRKKIISFTHTMELNDAEVEMLMNRIKMQKQARKLNTMILKAEDLKIVKKEEPSNKDDNNDQASKNIEKHL